MWSEIPAVQVTAYRVLKQIADEGWPQDLLDMLYLDDETKEWAESIFKESESDDVIPTKDSNGAILNSGDNVTIIKDLEVKGAGFTAKRGTVVKNITLTDNPEQIEGRVNGTKIVLLSKFLKKA
jgi:protein PhnA